MQSATLSFQHVWAQHAATSERFVLESAQLVAFPQPFSASASFATAQTPWYLDYGHLTFWFFFFAAFVIVLWLCYLCWALTRGTEQRKVVRETRGYSRAQTGDTLTAVLPLTWSVTMLAHAGTHSSNFDENTNATLFSFTVIAYQWGWNYYFPREIAELLVGAPRVVGHGQLVDGRAGDAYSHLLARARRDYLSQLRGVGYFGAKHGRVTLSSTLPLMLPALSDRGQVLPLWVITGVTPGVSPIAGLTEGAVAVGHASWAEITGEAYLIAASQRCLRARGMGGSFMPTGTVSLASVLTPVAGGASVVYGLGNLFREPRPLVAVTQGYKSPVLGAWAGNRLSQVHSHLATSERISTPSAYRVARLVERLLRADRWTLLTAQVQAALGGPLSAIPSLTNVNPILQSHRSSHPYAESAWVNAVRHGVWGAGMPITGGVVLQGCSFGGSTTPVLSSMQYVKPVPRARLLGSTGGWERVGSAFPTERFSQVALRGASLGILGGEQGVLSNADLRVNTAATASEVAGLNPTPAREPSFVGSLLFGGSNSLTAGLGRTEGRLAALAGLTGGQRAATFAAIEPVSPGVVTFSGVIAARVVTPCPWVWVIARKGHVGVSEGLYQPRLDALRLGGEYSALAPSLSIWSSFLRHWGVKVATELAPTAQLVAGAVDVCEGGPRLGLTGSDLRWLLLRQLGHFYRRGHGVSYNAGFPGWRHAIQVSSFPPHVGLIFDASVVAVVDKFVQLGLAQWPQFWAGLALAQLYTVVPVWFLLSGSVSMPRVSCKLELANSLWWGCTLAVMPSLGWQCCGEGLGLFDTRIVPHRWFPLWVVLEQDGVQMPEGWARLFIFWSTGFFWAEGVRTSILTGLGFGEARLSSLGAVVGYLWLSVGHSELAPIWARCVELASYLACATAPSGCFVAVTGLIRPISAFWLNLSTALSTLERDFCAAGSIFLVTSSSVRCTLLLSGFNGLMLAGLGQCLSWLNVRFPASLTPGQQPVTWSPAMADGTLVVSPSLKHAGLLRGFSVVQGFEQWAPSQVSGTASASVPTGVGVEGGEVFQVVTGYTPHRPVTQVTWLEGPAETQPIRIASVSEGDPIQVNARPNAASGAAVGGLGGPLGAWRYLWGWQTTAAAFPWDRNFRVQLARRPQTGLGVGKVSEASSRSLAAELLALQRQRFDKGASVTFVPRTRNLLSHASALELGRAVLDSERGGVLPLFASVLPLPYVDVDPTFLSLRWTNELNTSRRSDHDARFRVTWGPLAALWSKLGVQPDAACTWVSNSGPAVAGGLASRVWRELALLTQHDLATTTAHTRPLSVRLSRSEGSLLSNATPQGEVSVDWVGPVVRTCRPSGMLRQAAWLQRRLVGVQGFYGQPGTGLLPWSNLWELSGPYAQSGGYRGMVGGADTTQFWLTRLVTQVESYRQGVVVHSSSVGLAGGMPVSAPYSHPLVLLLGRVLAGSGDFGVEPTGAWQRAARMGYQPIVADISSQRRLRVTKGIYLPADVPMHGIFGSKDVIHSWAIPGLGVKIDCIPGYSSHRRLVFRWRGLYWGQCMEVCGRYHHWMPLLIRIVQKDVFLVWCLAYLRLLTTQTPSGVSVSSVATARAVWAVAEAVRVGV